MQSGKKIMYLLFIKINLCAQFAMTCSDHKNFSSKFPPKSEVRKRKLTKLKSALASQQQFTKVFSKESDATTEASFLMS